MFNSIAGYFKILILGSIEKFGIVCGPINIRMMRWVWESSCIKWIYMCSHTIFGLLRHQSYTLHFIWIYLFLGIVTALVISFHNYWLLINQQILHRQICKYQLYKRNHKSQLMNKIKITSSELFTNVIKSNQENEEIESGPSRKSSFRFIMKNTIQNPSSGSLILKKMVKKGISLSHYANTYMTEPNQAHEGQRNKQHYKSGLHFRPKTCVSSKNGIKFHSRTTTSINQRKKVIKSNKKDFVMSVDFPALQLKNIQLKPKCNPKVATEMKEDQQFLISQQYMSMKNTFLRIATQKKQHQQNVLLRRMKRVANLRSRKFQPIWKVHRLNFI